MRRNCEEQIEAFFKRRKLIIEEFKVENLFKSVFSFFSTKNFEH